MAMRDFTKVFYTLHNRPILIDCNFVIDSANGNGLGIRNLKGPGVANVFMHTSASPAQGSPNPEAGTAIIFLQDSYNRYFGGFSGFVSPLSGSNISSGMTIGRAYTITVLGASTLAQFQAAGLPQGTKPALGVAFIATATSISGGAMVQVSNESGIASIEVVGDPNQTLNFPGSPRPGQGAYLIVRFLNGSSAPTAPADGSVCGMSFYMGDSSILVQGE